MNDSAQPLRLLNSLFDRVYVLTLRRATDRHAHIDNELRGVVYTLFFGQDAKDFELQDLEHHAVFDQDRAIRNHRYGMPMSRGEIGCAWSHRLIYEDIVRNGYRRSLILEDDVVFDRATFKLLPEAMNELPPAWELLYLGFTAHEKAPPFALLKKGLLHALSSLHRDNITHKAIDNMYPRRISRHLYKSGLHDCCHAYAVTLSAAKTLKKLQTPICFLADNLIAYAATNEIVDAYIMLPTVAHQLDQVVDPRARSYVAEEF